MGIIKRHYHITPRKERGAALVLGCCAVAASAKAGQYAMRAYDEWAQCSQRNQQKKKPLRITRVIKKVGNRKRKSHKIEVMSRKGRKKIRRKTENGRIFSINGSTWGLDLNTMRVDLKKK